jgi:hypothetical protein
LFTSAYREMSTPYRGLQGPDMLKSHEIPAPTDA